MSIFEKLVGNLERLCEPTCSGHWCEPDNGAAAQAAIRTRTVPGRESGDALPPGPVAGLRQGFELDTGKRPPRDCTPTSRGVYERFYTMYPTDDMTSSTIASSSVPSRTSASTRTPESMGGRCRRGQGISEVLGSRLVRKNGEVFQIETRDILTVASRDGRLGSVLTQLSRCDPSGVDGRINCRSRSISPL